MVLSIMTKIKLLVKNTDFKTSVKADQNGQIDNLFLPQKAKITYPLGQHILVCADGELTYPVGFLICSTCVFCKALY